MTDGTEQRGRFPAGLQDGYFSVDEMSFTDLLGMSSGLASQLTYVDVSNVAAGCWGELFSTDETVVLASILSVDLDALQSAFLAQMPRSPVENLAKDIVSLALKIDFWLKALKAAKEPGARVIGQRINQLVNHGLGEQLRWVLERFGHAPQSDSLGSATRSLDDIWLSGRSGAASASQKSERQLLRTSFFAFIGAVGQLKGLAIDELPRSLQSQAHGPAMGLLMAFLQLYRMAQMRINRFTNRHAEFYYLDCLHMRPRPAEPDSVLLVCARDTQLARPVFIARGTQFSAGVDANGQSVVYCADDELVLTRAKVAQLYTLRLERDPLISPECELGYVTRMKVDRVDVAAAVAEGGAQRHWPLFGGAEQESEPSTAHTAQIGLAIASPLFWLKEGARQIRLTLHFNKPPDEHSLIAKLCASTAETFCACFGELFTWWLLSTQDWLEEGDLRDIRAAAERVLGKRNTPAPTSGDPLSLIIGGNRPEHGLIFDNVFNDLFVVSVTTATGWHEVANAFFIRAKPSADSSQSGVQIILGLDPQDAALAPYTAAVHGHDLKTQLPVVRLCLNTRAHLYPYSLLEPLALRQITMAVEVTGARDIVVYNNLGRLDPTKPFSPFGPLPERGSYLVLGSAEIAAKPISALELDIEWAGLPQTVAGFGEYYRGYDSAFDNDVFGVTLSVLRDGEWRPRAANRRSRTLFSSEGDSGRISTSSRLKVEPTDLRNHFKATPEVVGADTLQYGPATRNGLIKIELAEPPEAFGHQEYPSLLTRVVSANARSKRPVPVPNAPYTPAVERLTVNYRAHSAIHFDSQASTAADATTGGAVFHIHPCGAEQIYPGASDVSHPILPRYNHDGNLYIGLSASELAGALTLLFHMRDESASRQSAQPVRIDWAYLASNRWQRIEPARVLSDTTSGFLTSGIVALDVPAQINRLNTILPPELFWLRVAVSGGFEYFAGLYGVTAQALQATRAPAAVGAAAQQALPPGSIKEPVVSIPGLATVEQIGSSFGGRATETRQQLWTRTGERLRHKNRASAASDYERLVLERFPDVFKVKCFPSLTTDNGAASRGQVLIVVIPGPRTCADFDSTLGRRLNAIQLSRIRDFIRELASPFAQITVRNAAYERIQVRCTVSLARGAQGGASARRLNSAIVELLSPWTDGRYGARFDWVIRVEDVEACIRDLPDVEFVTKVSLLQISEDDADVFALNDTARIALAPTAASRTDGVAGALATDYVRPRLPWSIAIPMPYHIITTVDAFTDQEPQVTGIEELAIGSTFIVAGAGDD